MKGYYPVYLGELFRNEEYGTKRYTPKHATVVKNKKRKAKSKKH